jgi:DNA-binding PadR family transcriptional regulator
MALAHTILAVLSHAPCSGYDVSKQFEDCVSFFWKATQQQIYRELGKMQERGWVSYEIVPQAGKPDKKIYALTSAGIAELNNWCGEPSEPSPIREDLLVKVLASPYLPKASVLNELRRRRHVHDRQLKECLETEANFLALSAPQPSDVGRYLTLRRGIRFEQSWVDWCDEMLALFEQSHPFTPEAIGSLHQDKTMNKD